MKRLLLAFAALSLMATAIIPAKAGYCTTTCHPTYGGGSSCSTYCY